MNKDVFPILSVCLLLFVFWVIVAKNNPSPQTDNYQPLGKSALAHQRPTHPNLFFDEKTFYEGAVQTKKENKRSDYHIAGGIVPHDLFPGFILTDFFNRLSEQNPQTIILIGPNHYERGNYQVLSSVYGWETPFGVVKPNDTIINELVQKNLVKIDEEVLPHDHAVAAIMPFIKFYLPDTIVVPLLISGLTTQEEVAYLANNLRSYVNKETVFIAAVDFSHYLRNKEAQEKDEVSLEVIKNYDYNQLFTLNNDYLDSPPAIAALLMVMQKLGTTNMDVLHHTNSGELQKDDTRETTSYFSIAYY